jgi:hypothetical protein
MNEDNYATLAELAAHFHTSPSTLSKALDELRITKLLVARGCMERMDFRGAKSIKKKIAGLERQMTKDKT